MEKKEELVFSTPFTEIDSLKFCVIDGKEYADVTEFLKGVNGKEIFEQYLLQKDGLIKNFANKLSINKDDLFIIEKNSGHQMIDARLAISLAMYVSPDIELYGMMVFQDTLLNGVSYSNLWVKAMFSNRFGDPIEANEEN